MNTNNHRMPNGINKQTPRANRTAEGSENNQHSSNQSTPPSRPAVAATPASSSEPAPARQSAPPASSSASSGSKRTAPANEPRPVPASALAITADTDIGVFDTPLELLRAAKAIKGEAEPRLFLTEELAQKGWRDDNLDMVADCLGHDLNALGSDIGYMIERFSTVAENLSSFSYHDWQQLTVFWNDALWQLEKHYGDINYAIPLIHYAEQIWTSRSDQRCVRIWMLGNLWAHTDHRIPDMATVEAWFEDFGGLSEPERERCRRVWHDAHERAAYDALPNDFILQRSFLSDKLQEKLSCEGVAEFALQTARDWRTRFPDHPVHGCNHVVSRLVLKSSIIGLKRGLLASEGYCLYAVTAPWASSGLPK